MSKYTPDERLKKCVEQIVKADYERQPEEIINALMDNGENTLVEVWHEIKENEMMLCGVKSHISEMKDRESRIKNRIETLRGAMLFFLRRTNQSSYKDNLFTISLKELQPELTVNDESKIPTEYFITKEPELDKKLLREAIESGEVIEGCQLEEPKLTIQIRSK